MPLRQLSSYVTQALVQKWYIPKYDVGDDDVQEKRAVNTAIFSVVFFCNYLYPLTNIWLKQTQKRVMYNYNTVFNEILIIEIFKCVLLFPVF
jgi:hypothetical protein